MQWYNEIDEGEICLKRQHKKETIGHLMYRVVMMTIGATLAALSIELFLVPNEIIDGGVIGISLILDRILPTTHG
ncbi:hypothetical protein LR68_00158 [Anoxybacillus sp. BCO1]|nr:hypothetical protein LR68_00158 [Anoxybacillus sp. BCO1]